MRERTAHVVDFDAGEVVPDWLLAVDPGKPDAVRGTARFAQAVSLVEGVVDWFIIPTNVRGDILDVGESDGCILRAAAKTVRWPCTVASMFGPDDPSPDRGRAYPIGDLR